MMALSQAVLEGATPVRSQTVGGMRAGVIDDSVEMMPTLPLASAAVTNDMPSPVPKKADPHASRCVLGATIERSLSAAIGSRVAERKMMAANPVYSAIAMNASTPCSHSRAGAEAAKSMSDRCDDPETDAYPRNA